MVGLILVVGEEEFFNLFDEFHCGLDWKSSCPAKFTTIPNS